MSNTRIENWSIVKDSETDRGCLHGTVYNHRHFKNGDSVLTSSIIGKRDGKVVTASGSEYELGSVLPGYESLYPKAKARLLRSLDPVEKVSKFNRPKPVR